MKIRHVPIKDLHLDPDNPNVMTKSQKEALKKSLEKYGFVQPLVCTHDLKVINGNQKLTVAKEMGIKKIPCYVTDENLTEEDRLILQQVLNKVHGTHDKEKDRAIFEKLIKKHMTEEVADHLGTRKATFLKAMERAKEKKEKDIMPQNRVNSGDTWKLGNHLLVCGDSTKVIGQFLNQYNDVQMLLTDPPYGINVVKPDGNVGGNRKTYTNSSR